MPTRCAEMPPQVTRTRFLVISDTHDFAFDDPGYSHVRFQHPFPKVDVLLHCGDLTMAGGNAAYKNVLRMLGSIEAELKLVIAGNHDFSLDGPYWKALTEQDSCEDPKEHEQAILIMKGNEAKDAGVTYLEEGLHKFTLQNGASFTVYASPYQPEFCGYAFSYERDQDRFNPIDSLPVGVKSIAQNFVPNFPGVDIMMTHGPPRGVLDQIYEGRLTSHVGCDALLTAAKRSRPRLYCFGHIHEGHGATLVTWEDDMMQGLKQVKKGDDLINTYPKPLDGVVDFGKQTLMVNAAIKNVRLEPNNAPWLVDLDLPVVAEGSS